MNYKAVGFDFGGVIKGEAGGFVQAGICKLLGIGREEYNKAYYRHNKKLNRGQIEWEELWTLVLTDLGQPNKVKDVMSLSNDMFQRDLNQVVLKMVDEIRAKGFKTGLLSNNTVAIGAEIRAEGVNAHFDVVQISAETGFVKPELQAFRHFADALGVSLPELIFIDDSSTSLSTADKLGYTPILFTDAEQLHESLTALHVL